MVLCWNRLRRQQLSPETEESEPSKQVGCAVHLSSQVSRIGRMPSRSRWHGCADVLDPSGTGNDPKPQPPSWPRYGLAMRQGASGRTRTGTCQPQPDTRRCFFYITTSGSSVSTSGGTERSAPGVWSNWSAGSVRSRLIQTVVSAGRWVGLAVGCGVVIGQREGARSHRPGRWASGSTGLPLLRTSKCSNWRPEASRPISAICCPRLTLAPSLTRRLRLWP